MLSRNPPPPLGSWPSGVYYGDGSGGKYGEIPQARRCGSGLAYLNTENALDFGLYYPLPGEVQTVPRAELSILVTLVEIVEDKATIVYFGDNKQVVDLFNKGPNACAKASNADLYKLLFKFIHDKQIDITVYWMPSHLNNPQAKTKKGKPKIRPVWVHDYDIIGNNEADKLADRAAEMAELPSWLVEPLLENMYITRSIQLRIATIVCNLPHRKHNKKYCCSRAPSRDCESKQQALAKSMHDTVTTNSVVKCVGCLSQIHINSPKLLEFARSPCTPCQTIAYNTKSVGQVRIRNQVSHPSHDILSYRNIQFCNKCGYMVKRRMQNLIQPCNGSDNRSIHGQRVLDSIASGTLPPGVNFWPDLRPHAEHAAV